VLFKKGSFIITLTKVEIVNSIADQIGYTKGYSSEILETVLELIKKALESGDDVLITGFGKFCVKEKGERRGRNPSTGEEMRAGPQFAVPNPPEDYYLPPKPCHCNFQIKPKALFKWADR
jgi:integration host factor subunit alpha